MYSAGAEFETSKIHRWHQKGHPAIVGPVRYKNLNACNNIPWHLLPKKERQHYGFYQGMNRIKTSKFIYQSFTKVSAELTHVFGIACLTVRLGEDTRQQENADLALKGYYVQTTTTNF